MWNPTRRNRNIGTANQGFSKNNKLTIPSPCAVDKSFYERLGIYQKISRIINEHEFIFVIEETREHSGHACSVGDIERIIENIPVSDYGDLKLIVLRQPKRKEEIVSSVWGRLIYSYEFEGDYYPAVIIEAVDYRKKLSWPKSLNPENKREFERLKLDGHRFLECKNKFVAAFNIEHVRNTQLYRTVIHEFGHYVQYFEIVKRPGIEDEDFEEWEKRDDLYDKISKSDKEAYAHQYADRLSKKLKAAQIIPFDRIEFSQL